MANECVGPIIREFLQDEDGAVTVDWVVLTAALAGLGVAVATLLGAQFAPSADNLGTFLTDQTITTEF